MDKKYLIPIAVGVGVLILLLGAVALFAGGNTELGVGAVAAAGAAGEAERRRQARDAAQAELDALADKAAEDKAALEKLEKDTDDAMAKTDTDVQLTPLGDLVNEENDRRA